MKIINLIVLSSLFLCSATAQTIDDVLSQIKQNNTVLKAMYQYGEAEKIGNKTGIYLNNPEVEYHYLWGNKNMSGNRTDFSVSQSFDFPTAYHYKNKISTGKNQQVDMKYQIECKNILLEAKQTCIELIYLNTYYQELDKRRTHALQIANAYQSKYDKGDANILDLNKAKLNLLNAEKEVNTILAERDLMKTELVRMNGGNPVDFALSGYSAETLPADFDRWYDSQFDNNLSIRYIKQDIEINKKSEKLQRSMNLPKFHAGYMSEKVTNELFQGVMVGISIPLWENKNTVKQIKAQTLANQSVENDVTIRFYNETRALYQKATHLNQIVSEYKMSLSTMNNSDLLKKALDTGEISLINYIQELSIYYEAVNNLLETEKEYQLTVAKMKQWEL